MRHEKLYLTDIVEAAQAIERFLMGQDFNEFEQNEILNSAVLHGRILSDFAILPCMSILPSAGILPESPQWMTFPV
jgi:hypothetical protein